MSLIPLVAVALGLPTACEVCPEHRQSKMDDEHKDVPGYVWDSLACYSCHPDGKE